MADKDLISKAKRRIKRFIKTGEKQHRVTKNATHENVYNYRVHGDEFIHFRADKRGYLRQVI